MKKLILASSAFALIAVSGPALADHHMGKHDDKAKAEKMMDKEAKGDVVDVAMAKDDFSTLVAAVKAADLVETLKDDGPFTVFAPTNEAFAKLPEGTVEDLLKPENKEKLQALLTYHVVPSKVMADDIANGTTEVKTVQGTSAKVSKGATGVSINGANVVKADVKAENGVIHVIDSVIMPK